MSAGQASRARSLLLECRFLSLRVKDAELPVLGVRSRSPGHRDAVGSHTSYGTWVRSVQVRRSAHNCITEPAEIDGPPKTRRWPVALRRERLGENVKWGSGLQNGALAP